MLSSAIHDETESSNAYLLSFPWALWYIKDKLWGKNLRTIHWFPPGRVFQPGQQYEWKREPHTLGLMETRKKEQTNSLVTQTSQTYFSETPKQIHKVIFWAAPDLHGLCFQNKRNHLWYKASWVMDGVIFRRGRRGRKCAVAKNIRSNILFSLRAEFKLGKAGCISPIFFQIPCCPVLWKISKHPALPSPHCPPLTQLDSYWRRACSDLWPCLTDVRVITAYGALDWPDRLATKFSYEEMA